MGRTDTASHLLEAEPERVYAALVDADALLARLPPVGMTAKFDRFDGRPAGRRLPDGPDLCRRLDRAVQGDSGLRCGGGAPSTWSPACRSCRRWTSSPTIQTVQAP